MFVAFPSSFESRGLQIGCLKADLGRCHDAYYGWMRSISHVRASSTIYTEIDSALAALTPLGPLSTKTLLLETKGNWTVVVDDHMPYPDPIPTVSALAQKLGCQGVVACNAPDLKDPSGNQISYGATQLQIFSPRTTDFLNYKRTISVAHAEEGWRFDLAGEVQPYEDLARYKKRRIRERFDESMLISYLEAMGIECGHKAWFSGNGIVIPIGTREQMPWSFTK